jgi:SAM-dependent methyltransferase
MTVTSGAAFWDARFAGETFAYGEAPNAFLASQAARLRPGMAALVPGDGEGRNGVWLAERGLAVETLDLSAEGVAKARRLAIARGVAVEARQADALAWDWPRARYDFIALIYLHLCAPDRRRLHALALAALKPGGVIVLEAFRPEQIERQREGARGGPRDVELLYRLEDLREDFAAGDIRELAEVDVDLTEGALHLGPSAVVRALVAAR